MDELFSNAFKDMQGIKRTSVGVIDESLGNGRTVYVMLIKQLKSRLCYLQEKDEVYIYDKGIRKATISEIEKIVRTGLIQDIRSFQKSNDESIENIRSSIVTLKQPVDRYNIMTSIEDNAVYLCDVVGVEVQSKSKQQDKWEELTTGIGQTEGNVFFARNDRVRLDNAVLRYTCPRLSEEKAKSIDDIIFNGLGISDLQKKIIIEDLEVMDIFNYLKK